MTPRRSGAWDLIFRAAYAFIRLTDPLLRWTWFSVGLGITSRLTVRGRQTGRERSVLVGLIRVDRGWYVGHPNGEVAWTANLRHAGRARVARLGIDLSEARAMRRPRHEAGAALNRPDSHEACIARPRGPLKRPESRWV